MTREVAKVLVAALFTSSLRRLNVPAKVVAIDMRVTDAMVSRWGSGATELTLADVLCMAPEVRREIALRFARECGVVTMPDAVEEWLADLVSGVGRRVQAKARLSRDREPRELATA